MKFIELFSQILLSGSYWYILVLIGIGIAVVKLYLNFYF